MELQRSRQRSRVLVVVVLAACAGLLGLFVAAGGASNSHPAAAASSPTSTDVTRARQTASGFPDASTTGVPAGVHLTPKRDGLIVRTPGTVIDGLDIDGNVIISADNVTIRRSRIRASTDFIVKIDEGVRGAVLTDVEIDGGGTWAGSFGVYGAARVERANIWNVENGVELDSGSSLTDSFIHDLKAPGEPHYDGVQLDGGRSNITIRHNTIITDREQTSAVMIGNDFGPTSNIVLDGNLLSGGTYTVYSDASGSSGRPITGVQIINNHFGEHRWGYALVRGNTLAASVGNVDASTGAPIDP